MAETKKPKRGEERRTGRERRHEDRRARSVPVEVERRAGADRRGGSDRRRVP